MADWLLKPEIAREAWRNTSSTFCELTATQQHLYRQCGVVEPGTMIDSEALCPSDAALYAVSRAPITPVFGEDVKECLKDIQKDYEAERDAYFYDVMPHKEVTFEDDDWDTPLYEQVNAAPLSTFGNIISINIKDATHKQLCEFVQEYGDRKDPAIRLKVCAAYKRITELEDARNSDDKEANRLLNVFGEGLNQAERKHLYALLIGGIRYWKEQESILSEQLYRQRRLNDLELWRTIHEKA